MEDPRDFNANAGDDAQPDPAAEPGRSEIWIQRLQDTPHTDTVWNALHERYRRRILVYAHYRLGPELRRLCDPEDVVNEAWMRIVTAWNEFDYRGPDSLFHWLCLQVRRVILDRRRKHDRRAPSVDDGDDPPLPPDVVDVTEPGAGPRTQVMQRDLQDRLTGALETVPEIYRQVLVAVILEGQAPGDVAVERGMKTDTVRKQLSRGLEHWRQALGSDPERFF